MLDDPWPPELLEAMAHCGDPEADELVVAFNDGVNINPGVFLYRLINQGICANSDDPDERDLAAYLAHPEPLPVWADPDQIMAGQQFFQRQSLPLSACLFYASLPHAFAMARGAKVLTVTGLLHAGPARRIAETGQFLFDVMGMNDGQDDDRTTVVAGLAPGSQGHAAARRVRVFHAAVRNWILTQTDEPWDPGDGTPINQEDLLGTVLTFTIAALRALETMEVSFTDDEAEAYMHTWCVIGHLLGIRGPDGEDVLPMSREAGERLAERYRETHEAPSDEGALLTAALLADGQGPLPRPVAGVPNALLHQLTGSLATDVLGAPAPSRSLQMCMRAFQNVSAFTHRNVQRSPLRWLSARLSKHILVSYIKRARDDRSPWQFGGVQPVSARLRAKATQVAKVSKVSGATLQRTVARTRQRRQQR